MAIHSPHCDLCDELYLGGSSSQHAAAAHVDGGGLDGPLTSAQGNDGPGLDGKAWLSSSVVEGRLHGSAR